MKFQMLPLLLVSFSFCSDCFDITAESNNALRDASLPIGAVLLLTIAIIALSFIYGKSANDAKALLFSKDEFFHLTFSVFLLIAVVGFITVFCYIGSNFLISSLDSMGVLDSCSNKPSPAEMSDCYLSKMEQDATKMVSMAIDLSVQNEMSSTWVYTFNIPFMATTTTPTKAYKKAYSATFDVMNSLFATPALISISMQKLFVENFLTISLTMLLPSALLLRIFMPTRQMGNLLIAVIIAIQVFLPLMYVLNGVLYKHVFTEEECAAEYSTLIDDHLFGDCNSPFSLLNFARLMPQAVFLPNLTAAILITFLGAINKALKVIDA